MTYDVMSIDVAIDPTIPGTNRFVEERNLYNQNLKMFVFVEDDLVLKKDEAKCPIKNEIYIRSESATISTDGIDIKIEDSSSSVNYVKEQDVEIIKKDRKGKVKIDLHYDDSKHIDSSDDKSKVCIFVIICLNFHQSFQFICVMEMSKYLKGNECIYIFK